MTPLITSYLASPSVCARPLGISVNFWCTRSRQFSRGWSPVLPMIGYWNSLSHNKRRSASQPCTDLWFYQRNRCVQHWQQFPHVLSPATDFASNSKPCRSRLFSPLSKLSNTGEYTEAAVRGQRASLLWWAEPAKGRAALLPRHTAPSNPPADPRAFLDSSSYHWTSQWLLSGSSFYPLQVPLTFRSPPTD